MAPLAPARVKTAGGEVSSGRGCLRFRSHEWCIPAAAVARRLALARCPQFDRWYPLEATLSQSGLRPHRRDQLSRPHDIHDARQIIGEDVERHLGGHAWQPLHQEVGCSHPRLERPERMVDRLAPLAHFFWVLVEPALDELREYARAPNA